MKASYEDDPQSLNQSVRWINTKEHASQIITTVSEYFLTQKLKDVGEKDDKYNDYLIALALHQGDAVGYESETKHGPKSSRRIKACH